MHWRLVRNSQLDTRGYTGKIEREEERDEQRIGAYYNNHKLYLIANGKASSGYP